MNQTNDYSLDPLIADVPYPQYYCTKHTLCFTVPSHRAARHRPRRATVSTSWTGASPPSATTTTQAANGFLSTKGGKCLFVKAYERLLRKGFL